MQIFISWSGKRAKAVALALREWLPDVIQSLDPWMSKVDIDGGAKWNKEISSALEASDVGIIVVTPENQAAPWLLFEAGALAKKTGDTTRVIPYFVDMDESGLRRSPLTTFQGKKSDEEGTRELLGSVNKCMGKEALPGDRLDRAFDRGWGELDEKIKAAVAIKVKGQEKEPEPDMPGMVKEILSTVRGMARSQSGTTIRAWTEEEIQEQNRRNAYELIELERDLLAELETLNRQSKNPRSRDERLARSQRIEDLQRELSEVQNYLGNVGVHR